MADYGTLSKPNPDLSRDRHAEYQALYEGGEMFRCNIERFLDRSPLESADVYNLRKKQARYRSYVGPIVNYFTAALFAAPYTVRTLDLTGATMTSRWAVVYQAFKESCDAAGNDLTTFMEARFAQALVHRVSLIVVERSVDANGDAIPLLRAVAWDEVTDWGTDSSGVLQWITLHKCQRRRDKATRKDVITETWTVIDAMTVDTYALSYPEAAKPCETTPVPLLSSVPHGFSTVPVAPLEVPKGLWVLSMCADAQIEHFQLSAALAWVARRTCYPMMVHKRKATNDDDKRSPRITGPGLVQTIDIGEEMSYVSPDNAPFEVLRQLVGDAKDEIYRVAHQMANSAESSASALGRSAESKYADHAATETLLRAYGNVVKECIEHVFALVAEVLGDTETVFSVEGLTHFDLDDADTLFKLLERADGVGALSSSLLATELKRRLVLALMPDASAEVRERAAAEWSGVQNTARPTATDTTTTTETP